MTRKKGRKIRRTVALIGACLLVLLVIGYLALRMAAPSLTGFVLEKVLNVPVHIGQMRLSLTDGTITVADIRLDQPEGFEHEPMLSVERIEVSGWIGFIFSPHTVADVRVHTVEVNITTDRDKRTNLLTMIESMSGDTEESAASTAMKVGRIVIDPIRIVARDYSVVEGGTTQTLEAGNLEVIDLTLGVFPDSPVGSVQFHGELVQQDVENAKLAFAARFGPIENDYPNILGAAAMTGALYQTFVPVIPAGTDLILGGEGFDLDVDMALSEGRMLVTGAATTSTGSAYPFRIQGAIDEPVIELPDKLASVASRMTGGVGRLVGSAFSSGKEILVGTVDTAASLGRGALNATGSFLKGVGSVSTGIVSGDGDASTKGFNEMTSETGGNLSGAVTDSADAIGEAGGRTSNALANDPKFQTWVEQIPTRHEEWVAYEIEVLRRTPFPPEIPAASEEAM